MYRSKRSRHNPSRTSPRESRRACLCANGTYSRKCCNGNMINQGIGSVYGVSVTDNTVYAYLVTNCANGHQHHVNITGQELIIGLIYYMTLNNGHSDCYRVESVHNGNGNSIDVLGNAYSDCSSCTSENP